MSGRVVVDMGCGYVVVVVFWSVQASREVDEGVCFCCYSEAVEVGDVEDAEFGHEWSCLCSGW